MSRTNRFLGFDKERLAIVADVALAERDVARRQRDWLAKLAERAADAIEMLQDSGEIGGGHGILGHAQNIRDALAELDSDPGAKT